MVGLLTHYSQPPLPPPNSYNHRSATIQDMSHRALPPPPPPNFPPGPIMSNTGSHSIRDRRQWTRPPAPNSCGDIGLGQLKSLGGGGGA